MSSGKSPAGAKSKQVRHDTGIIISQNYLKLWIVATKCEAGPSIYWCMQRVGTQFNENGYIYYSITNSFGNKRGVI